MGRVTYPRIADRPLQRNIESAWPVNNTGQTLQKKQKIWRAREIQLDNTILNPKRCCRDRIGAASPESGLSMVSLELVSLEL